MNGLAGDLLLTPQDFTVIYPTDVWDNHEILAIREGDAIPAIFLFHKATSYGLVSGVFIVEADLVHSGKIVNPIEVVNVFGVD